MKEHGICVKCKKFAGCPYADDRIKGCKKFVIEDELELTNEEQFCSLPTEQKAKWLSDTLYACMRCGMGDGKGYCPFGKCITEKDDAFKWLKEKYNEQ